MRSAGRCLGGPTRQVKQAHQKYSRLGKQEGGITPYGDGIVANYSKQECRLARIFFAPNPFFVVVVTAGDEQAC